jgi:hypothetical protein
MPLVAAHPEGAGARRKATDPELVSSARRAFWIRRSGYVIVPSAFCSLASRSATVVAIDVVP